MIAVISARTLIATLGLLALATSASAECAVTGSPLREGGDIV